MLLPKPVGEAPPQLPRAPRAPDHPRRPRSVGAWLRSLPLFTWSSPSMALSVASSVPLRTPLYWIRGRSCPSVTSLELVTSATALEGRGPREREGHACRDANEARTVGASRCLGGCPGMWAGPGGVGEGTGAAFSPLLPSTTTAARSGVCTASFQITHSP